MKKTTLRQLAWLFCINLFISAFTFGGGYVVIPMIRKYFVQKKHFLTEEEVMELAAISQSSPGAIAVNGAIVVGYKLVSGGIQTGWTARRCCQLYRLRPARPDYPICDFRLV